MGKRKARWTSKRAKNKREENKHKSAVKAREVLVPQLPENTQVPQLPQFPQLPEKDQEQDFMLDVIPLRSGTPPPEILHFSIDELLGAAVDWSSCFE